jgi:hypothetical protein
MSEYESSAQIKILREDQCSVAIYRNQVDSRVYYDIVISRLVLVRKPDGSKAREWRRGANLKPGDLPKIGRLLEEARQFLDSGEAETCSSSNLDLSAIVP